MRITWRPHLILPVIFTFFAALLTAQPTSAADSFAPGVQLSPTKQSLTLDPGQSQAGTFSVTNVGTEPVTVEFSATPYYPADQNYNPDFTSVNTYTQLSKWITFEQPSVTIAPDDSFIVNFTITVPEDVPAGGQYAALFAETVSEQSGTFQITGRVGTLLLTQINGDTRTEGELLSQDFPTFSLSAAPVFGATIKNTGNIDFPTTTALRIQGLISRKIYYDNTDHPITANILPNTTRYLTISPPDLPSIGIFQATYTVNFLGQDHTIDQVFFVIPLWLILAVTFFIIFLVIFLILRHQRRRHSPLV